MAADSVDEPRPSALRRRLGLIGIALVCILALIIAILALRDPGAAVSDVSSDDGGVWVLNRGDGRLGRVNVDAAEFDALLRTDGAEDVLQSGTDVFVRSSSGIKRVNTGASRTEGLVDLASSDTVLLGGDRAVVLRETGQMWILTPDQLAAFDPSRTKPTYSSDSGDMRAVVTHAGDVLLLEGEKLKRFPRSDSTPVVKSDEEWELKSGRDKQNLQLSAVGDDGVILDPSSGVLEIPQRGTRIDLSDAGVTDAAHTRLQEPSDDGSSVLLAGSDSLFAVPVKGGKAERLRTVGVGEPIAPVQAGGCLYGAWNGSGTYVKRCGSAKPIAKPIPSAGDGGQLRFRENYGLVVLNDTVSGRSWMIQDAMQIVDQWDAEQDLDTELIKEKKKDTYTSQITNVPPDRQAENRKPVAKDDEFGVRAGESVVLPVTANDTDPDGDVLVARATTQPGIGTVSPVQSGTALQIDVAPEATGSAEFRYQVDDGRGGTAQATVRLKVHPDSENTGPAPVEGRIPQLKISQGATVDFNVLSHYRDPEGDPFFLAEAKIDSRDDIVTSRPDGTVTFNDAGVTTGEKKVKLTFRDVRGGESTQEMRFTVVPDPDLPPVTTPDHVQIVAGRTTTLSPLLNDLRPGTSPLELLHVSSDDGLTVTPDLKAGTVKVTGEDVRPHYLTYQVGAGAETVQGIIRVDIVAPSSDAMKPIAVDDVALVTSGRSTLIDPVANDVDPTGGVLVVSSATVDPSSGLTVTVLDHHLLRITADASVQASPEPVEVTYEVANATGTATGKVRTMVISPDTQFAQPTVAPDKATVRAGDVVTIPVLDNDRSAVGARLALAEITDQKGARSQGDASIVEDQIRFRARPDARGEATLTYRATDETGRSANAKVSIRITPEDRSNNPPNPEDSVARTVSGTTTRIPIRTSGIDPDGDSTILTGLVGAPPTLGRVTKASGSYIEYEAFEGTSGTDTITYQVSDMKGAIGTATITVGVAKPSTTNLPPVTRPDTIRVRPDRNLQMFVLENDFDPEGENLTIDRSLTTSDPKLPLDPPTTQARIPSLDTKTPTTPGTYSISYGASDGQLSSAGAATVLVEKNAPLKAPIARDDYVDPLDVTDPRSKTVSIDLLANDQDPDGSVADLSVELVSPPAGASVDRRGRATIRKTPQMQRIAYTITDQDKQSSTAFIWVPGTTAQEPRWIGPPIQAQAGKPVQIDLRDPKNVRTRAGAKGPTITDAKKVSAGKSDGAELVASPSSIRYTPRADASGDDVISVPVTDADTPDGAGGATGTLAIPVQIRAEKTEPPIARGASLTVAAGEGARTVDLARSAKDPAGKPLFFTFGDSSHPNNVHVSSKGSVLTVAADADAEVGRTYEVPVQVSNGDAQPVSVAVTIQIAASQRMKPQAGADSAIVDVGKPATVSVLDNDFNPFPDKPLVITGVQTVAGGVDATHDGSKVTLTARRGFSGTATVSYTIQDATKQPGRAATGTITAQVRDRPGVPSAPRITREGDSQVDLQFNAGPENGAPITGYRVVSDTGGISQSCPGTTCTITGLKNGEQYRFRAIAINAVGESDPSSASAVAHPDVKPDAPAAPTLKRGDGQLDASWQKPGNRGSALIRYELQLVSVSGGGTVTTSVPAGSTSTTFESLANGTDYRVRVRAVNGAKDPSDWSPYSSPEHPAGKPKAPASTPRAQRVETPLGREITVTVPKMSTAEANGEPITQYIVRASDGKEVTIGGGEAEAHFRGLDANKDYTFTYTGVNSVGRGTGQSPRSAAVKPFSVAGTPQNVTATIDQKSPSDQATVSWRGGQKPGDTALTGYVIRYSGGPEIRVGASTTSRTVTGLANGRSYSFTVQAINGSDGGQSPLSKASNSVTPYTKPQAPEASGKAGSCSGSTCSVTFTARANGSGGADPVTLACAIDGGKAKPCSGTQVVNGSGGQKHTIVVTATNAKGLTSQSTAEATAPAPEPKLPSQNVRWSSQGSANNEPKCTVKQNCTYVTLTFTDLVPGRSYKMDLWNLNGPQDKFQPYYSATVKAGADGTAMSPTLYYGYQKSTGNPMVVKVENKEVARLYAP